MNHRGKSLIKSCLRSAGGVTDIQLHAKRFLHVRSDPVLEVVYMVWLPTSKQRVVWRDQVRFDYRQYDVELRWVM